MSEGPAITVQRRRSNSSPTTGRARPSPPDAWNFETVAGVEIVAPDQYCAALLLDYAAPYFPAELVSDSAWVVRFHPPPSGREWVIELLTLVERWLKAAPLPCAKLVHGDRNYLIRTSTGGARFAADTASAQTTTALAEG